ncbi:hypothetical protein ACLQ2S_24730 [Micromonospora sp. DT48]|uniref:hypothetical protein n=1 Tax=Micromonospora sp. DT48 TaxID=3393429 RepID=UPI003CF98780
MIHEMPLHPGTLVTVADMGWKQPPGELYVVLRDTGNGRVSLVPLGGNNGRHWRGVFRHLLTTVDPTRDASTSSRPPEQRPALPSGRTTHCPPDTT